MKTTVLLVAINPGLSIEGSPPSISLGAAYSYTLKAHGSSGKYTFAQSGSLPSGITFTDNGDGTATLAGSTTAAGSYPIAVTVSASGGGTVAAEVYTYVLVVPALTLQLVQPGITRGVAVSGMYAFPTGGSGVYSFTQSGLPAGLSISSSTGVISGSVTAAVGTYTATITVTDSLTNSASITVAIVVKSRLAFTAASPPDTEPGLSYGYQFAISGATGTTSFTISAGAAPSGITISSGGLLSGMTFDSSGIDATPLAYTFTVTASDTGTGESISIACAMSSWDGFGFPS